MCLPVDCCYLFHFFPSLHFFLHLTIHFCLRMQKLDVKRLGETPMLTTLANPSSPLSSLVLSLPLDSPSRPLDLLCHQHEATHWAQSQATKHGVWKHKSRSGSLEQEWGREKKPKWRSEVFCPRGSNSFYTCERGSPAAKSLKTLIGLVTTKPTIN